MFSLLMVAALAFPADDHQTATVEVAIGAELTIQPRTPDLAVMEWLGADTRITLTPDPEVPSATRSVSVDTLALGMIGADEPEERIFFNSLYARARASATASNNDAEAVVVAAPSVDLINALDTPILVRLIVDIPGRFPTSAATAVPNEYFDRGSVDANETEVASGLLTVAVIPWDIDFDPMTDDRAVPLIAQPRTRDPMVLGPPGPVTFEHFGVPFQREYRIPIQPSFRVMGDVIEIKLEPVTLWVEARAQAISVLDSTSEPIQFKGTRPLCELAPPRRVSEFLPDLDPLCRAGRAGASRRPICDCTRDDSARSQRCAFTFSDFHLVQQLPAPAFAGEQVQVEWAIHPSTDGQYAFRPEILIGGKWVSIQAKEKLDGKLASGKEARTKLSFTMPSQPTVLRTRMIHLPKGAKKPIESQIDTVIAMRKQKLPGK